VRPMGTGGRKSSKAASRKNASLIGEMGRTRELISRNLTSRACRFTGYNSWSTESSCLANIPKAPAPKFTSSNCKLLEAKALHTSRKVGSE
jgi:hypothetical protein